MAMFQKTAGLKLQVGKKGEYTYLIIAGSLSLVLLAGAGYSIWYSSDLLQRLSARPDMNGVQAAHFSVSQAEANARLQSAQSWLATFSAATSTATTTPSVSPKPRR